MKKTVPLLITALVGITMILAAFIPHWPFSVFELELSVFFNIIAAFAFFLGAGNLLQIHLGKVSKQVKGWGYSAVCVIGFVVTLVAGLFKLGNPAGITGALEEPGSWFAWIYDWMLAPLQSTMFSLLAFFVASASYRAFRAKNREATMLLIAAFVILIGRTLLGTIITDVFPGIVEMFFGAILLWIAFTTFKAKQMIATGVLGVIGAAATGFGLWGFISKLTGNPIDVISVPELVNWIMVTPQLAGQRAIMIGICLGVISMSLRIIIGVERSHLGSDSE